MAAAVERWLRDEVVPVAVAMQANPDRVIPAETAFAKVRALHAQRARPQVEIEAFKDGAEQPDAMLAANGVSENELVSDFKTLRSKRPT